MENRKIILAGLTSGYVTDYRSFRSTQPAEPRSLDNFNSIGYTELAYTPPYTRKEVIKMTTTRVFQNGNSQALRIPQEMRTDRKEYCINKIGDIFIAYPSDDPWAPVRQVIGTFPEDFMADRNQPTIADLPQREAF